MNPKFIKCSEPTCQNTVTNHMPGRMIDGAEWFFMRDRSAAWCPTHLPEWVPEYRAKKESRK